MPQVVVTCVPLQAVCAALVVHLVQVLTVRQALGSEVVRQTLPYSCSMVTSLYPLYLHRIGQWTALTPNTVCISRVLCILFVSSE